MSMTYHQRVCNRITKVAHEPDYLKGGELRTITKDQFKKYEWEAA